MTHDDEDLTFFTSKKFEVGEFRNIYHIYMTHDDEDLTYLHEIGTGGLISLSILSFVNAKVL